MRQISLNRPQQCPYRTKGCHGVLCGHPAGDAPLYCDTAENALAKDRFPGLCPLPRLEE